MGKRSERVIGYLRVPADEQAVSGLGSMTNGVPSALRPLGANPRPVSRKRRALAPSVDRRQRGHGAAAVLSWGITRELRGAAPAVLSSKGFAQVLKST